MKIGKKFKFVEFLKKDRKKYSSYAVLEVAQQTEAIDVKSASVS